MATNRPAKKDSREPPPAGLTLAEAKPMLPKRSRVLPRTGRWHFEIKYEYVPVSVAYLQSTAATYWPLRLTKSGVALEPARVGKTPVTSH